MKNNLQATLFLFLVCTVFHFTTMASSIMYSKANEMYRNQNYTEAANLYLQIINDGYTSYNIYYNAGNALYKSNKLGLSIWCYEKALQQQPQNNLIVENLALANSKIKPKLLVPKEIFFIRWFKNCIYFHSLNKWAIFSLLFFIAFKSIVFVRKQKNISPLFIPLKKIFRLLFVVYFIGMISLFFYTKYTPQAIVINAQPSIAEGTKVKILEVAAPKTRILLPNQTTNWVLSKDLKAL